MDWLKGMNNVVEYIEENLTQPIQYESLSHIVGCSVYEFSRIFSLMFVLTIKGVKCTPSSECNNASVFNSPP